MAAATTAAPLRKISEDEFKGGRSASAESTEPIAGDERVHRYKVMFREEWDKPFWRDLRENVAIDRGYYTGSGHWTQAQRQAAANNQKPALTINHILPVMNTVFGLERTNRSEPKVVPRGEEGMAKVPEADLFTRLMRQTMEENDGEYVLSRGFETGTVGGVVAYELPIEFDEDAVHGDIRMATVDVPGELIWATPWFRYDLRDTRAMFRHRWVDVDVLLSMYPKDRAAIKEALRGAGAITARDSSGDQAAVLNEGNPADAYQGEKRTNASDDLEFWFRVSENRVRVLQVYYPEFYPKWILASDDGKTVIRTSDEKRMEKIFKDMAERSGGNMTVIERNERKIRMMVCLPATDHVLAEGIEFKKHDGDYPYVPFFCYWFGNEIFGVVKNLRDPQDEINARRSQISWLTKATGDGWFAEEDTMVDLKAFESDSRDPKGVYQFKKNGKAPERIPPPNIPQGLFELLKTATNELHQIAGVKPDLEQPATQSGVAMARVQHREMVTTAGPFDNFRLTKRLLWRMMAHRIQECYTDERIVRLYNYETAKHEFVTLNARAPLPGQDPNLPPEHVRYQVINNVGALKYDVLMSEAPMSPTARAAALTTLLDLIQKIPALAELFVDKIIELSDGIPGRQEFLVRVRQWMATLGKPKKTPPKISISLKGEDLPADIKEAIARMAAGDQEPESGKELGAQHGNDHNPSGQLPTGGEKLEDRPDFTPPA